MCNVADSLARGKSRDQSAVCATTIIKWPDFEAWVAWVTPRRKRLGKPKERGTVIWFPRIHPIYAAGHAKRQEAKKAAAAKPAKRSRARAGAK